MDAAVANLYRRDPSTLERFEELCVHPGARVERIWGPVRAPSEVYDQAHDEWVVLLAGQAVLEPRLGAGSVELQPGDHLMIPAGQRHRVLEASPDALWLAVHFAEPSVG